ncbi:Alpha/Beta hydrolase protein [Xylaria palmicola]|nr:Alpha/Beta hydrolase protein [Xylaria palmicola]
MDGGVWKHPKTLLVASSHAVGYTTNSNANWNGTEVVRHSGRAVVLVNFNYRVGLSGFLAGGRVRADGDLNAGLLDQRRLLRWVRRHIAQFGGDPGHVVIHGASAGAGSVALHLVAADYDDDGDDDDGGGGGAEMGAAERLFVGAVGESVFFPAQPRVGELEWQFDLVLRRTGCDSVAADGAMACLRGKSTERGQFVDVPMMMGITTDEGTVSAADAPTRDHMAAFLQSNYPLLSDANTSAIIQRYPQTDSLPGHEAWFPSTASAYGEATFTCPTALILRSYARYLNSSRAWGYRYDVRDAENAAAGLGVPHIWESWAVFGPDSPAGPGGGPRSYYTHPGAPRWESWGPDGRRLLVQTGNVSVETVPDGLKDRCAFWDTLAPVIRQ